MSPDDKVKVQFRVDPNDQLGIKTESLWAEMVGPGRFCILNSPFFLFGISADDVVEAEETNNGWEFQTVVSRGGHSTYRIFLQDGRTTKHPDFRISWKPISELGATFENANDHFVAVDIPPGRDVAAIYELMAKGEQDGIWAFEEVYYAGQRTQ
ncbi:DUF4265 domain-containing protein [Bradyrhizobium sp.]|jgi:hypothetical protein|uniref:DUF4265 domain-containing protein n=1 Tax=Bradyrhizobium sp. TaxID=376 RepID=UPI002B84147C|nr:DUF4265 domain-containing protein [Bradyrhizobium sp.]HWX62908.1 DUF4265 domain-containing protein [Bradyrhizobium sp.]